MVICFLATVPTGVTHDRLGDPSLRTVQAPHWPSPHPYLLPVKSRWSRRTVSRLVCESASMRCLLPLTNSSAILSISHPKVEAEGSALNPVRIFAARPCLVDAQP